MSHVWRDDQEVEIPTAEVWAGDIVIVRPGERIPVDGVVTEGDTQVDASMLTGVAMAGKKGRGATGAGAHMNQGGGWTIKRKK